jgi:hypothetical protein
MSGDTFFVLRVPDRLIRPTVEGDHYIHRWPDPRSLPFGYALCHNGSTLHRDGRPWGLVVMKKLQHHKQRGLFGYEGLPTAWQVLDLARVWVHPELQSVAWEGTDRKGQAVRQTLNVFSRMVGAVLRRVQRDWLEHHPPVYPELPYHIELIVSYCELAHHDGTGYRAAGFTKWGPSEDGTKEVYVRRLRRPHWDWQRVQLVMEGIA